MSRASLIYRNPHVYQLVMRGLYGRHYGARYAAVASEVPEDSEVVDVCAGDCHLYLHHLRTRRVRYVALDNAPDLVHWARGRGVDARSFDAASQPVPPADVVIMQGSLYQFLPDVDPIVERMLRAARRRVIIAEPVRNLTQTLPFGLGRLVAAATRPGGSGTYRGHRFDEATLRGLFARFGCARVFATPGGRELVGVFDVGGEAR